MAARPGLAFDRANPFPRYANLRREHPVALDAERDVWSVYRYADVQRVLSDHTSFSSRFRFPRQQQSGEAPPPGQPEGETLARSLLASDPPRHTKLRALVSRAFTPRAVAQLEPFIQSLADQLLDRAARRGQLEVMADLAGPLPVTVIATLLGIPVDDRERFKRWSDALIGSTEETAGEGFLDSPDRRRAQQELADYFRDVLCEKRRRPADDLIGGLLAAELDGERLGEEDLLAFCTLLLIAGHETTTNLIGNGVLSLLEQPEELARLRADPALVPLAVEEVLRYRSPVQTMGRLVARDTELGGQRLVAGQRVIAWIGSANRDEAVFTAPERLDVGRSPNPHLAFGFGIHFCLGAPLARLEGRIVLGSLLERCEGLALDPHQPVEMAPGFIMGCRRLAVRCTAVGGS